MFEENGNMNNTLGTPSHSRSHRKSMAGADFIPRRKEDTISYRMKKMSTIPSLKETSPRRMRFESALSVAPSTVSEGTVSQDLDRSSSLSTLATPRTMTLLDDEPRVNTSPLCRATIPFLPSLRTAEVSVVSSASAVHQVCTAVTDQGSVHAEYVYVDEAGVTHSTWQALDKIPQNLSEVPLSNTTLNGKTLGLIPTSLYEDPFKGDHNLLVVCEATKLGAGLRVQAAVGNTRRPCVETLARDRGLDASFTVRQEVGLVDAYGQDVNTVLGNSIMLETYEKCVKAGVPVGTNDGMSGTFEVSRDFAGKWNLSIKKAKGVSAADHLVATRFILQRVAAVHGLRVSTTEGALAVTLESLAFVHMEEQIKRALVAKHAGHLRAYQSVVKKQSLATDSDVNLADVSAYMCSAPGTHPEDLVKYTQDGIEDSRAHASCDIYNVLARMVQTAADVLPQTRKTYYRSRK